jgi:hypothetical protein
LKEGVSVFYHYILKLALRVVVFAAIIWAYFAHHELFFDWTLRAVQFMPFSSSSPPIASSVWILVIWALLAINLGFHLFSNKSICMAGRKQFKEAYEPRSHPINPSRLLKLIKEQNLRAAYSMVFWISLNAIIAVLYLYGAIGIAELFLLFAFYVMFDFVALLIWCPFQTFFMKNRCCANCRIFNWGHFMMYTPLAFIPSFFTWSLFLLSIAVMLRWEINFAKYPERFFMSSNAALSCKNCTEKLCRIKSPLTGKGRPKNLI